MLLKRMLGVSLGLAVVVCMDGNSNGAQMSVLEYEPAVVRIAGTITRGEGITTNGEKVTFPALKLKSPVRVKASSDNRDDMYEPADNVSLIQLVLSDTLMIQYRQFTGKSVTLTGTLFGQHTGHHYTKVLMTVQKIEGDNR